MKIYNRQTKKIETKTEYGGKYLDFLYNTAVGRLLLKVIVSPSLSRLYGRFNDSPLSRKKIKKFIEKNGIDMSLYEKKNYRCFNDFFTRKKLEPSFDEDKNHFISPADSKLCVFDITDNLEIKIKRCTYTLPELTGFDESLSDFRGGKCLVFRLSVDDYHRYCNVDSGRLIRRKFIRGVLHTVRSVSESHRVFAQNCRLCSYLDTDNFGKLFYVCVGAMLVGRMKEHNKKSFKKGEEKGYFETGGSTVIILTQKGRISLDDDILSNSEKQIETKVKYGERIGEKS